MSNDKKEMKYSPDAECEKMMQKLELIKQAKEILLYQVKEVRKLP